jgi:hypothetical protein
MMRAGRTLMRRLIALAALVALASSPAAASPASGSDRAIAVRRDIANQQGKISATYRDGRISQSQAGALKADLQSLARSEQRALRHGEITGAQYSRFEARLSAATERMAAFENAHVH